MSKTCKTVIAVSVAAAISGLAIGFAVATKKAMKEIDQIRFDKDDLITPPDEDDSGKKASSHQYVCI